MCKQLKLRASLNCICYGFLAHYVSIFFHPLLGSIAPLPAALPRSSELNNEKLAQMESKLDQCALQDDLMNLQRTVEDKTQEFHGSMNLLNDQIKTMDDGIDSMIRLVQVIS